VNAQIQRVFDDVADLTPEQRLQYFDEHRIDSGVREEVESLLAFDHNATQHLSKQILSSVNHLLDSASSSRCGAWQLEKLLGRGGMGAVYLARRDDGEVQQRAAVKLIPSGGINLRERFLRERQILASLNHPNIARLLDAGRQAEGHPFLVMEFVDGQAIDIYASKLALPSKIRLFLKVCDAVSYAHRQLVVHRDLKPSNILITEAGEPKLLDFGIAKIIGDASAPQTVERFLTPGYSSPEQVRGDAIGTATDIYSLGAVLYRLLTGYSPHDPSATGSEDSWEKIILTSEPKPPTTFHRELPRDLDFIVLRALKKDPHERYASVDHLVEDLRALSQSRPVQARAAGKWYRTTKFLRRNWANVSAALAVLIAFCAGMYALNRERNRAQQRFDQVRQLANRLFDIDAEVRKTPGTTAARQMIVNTSLEYLEKLMPDAGSDPALALELGNAYLRVARVQGVPIGSTLGQMDKAEQSLNKAEALVERVLAAQPSNRTAWLRSAQIAHDRQIIAGLSRRPETLGLVQKSVERMDRFVTLGPMDRFDAEAAILTYQNAAIQLARLNRLEDAVRYCRRAVDISREANMPDYAGASLSALSNPLRMQGKLEEALAAIDEAITLLKPPPGSAHLGRTINYITALSRKGTILGDPESPSLGRTKEAAQVLEQAFQLAEDVVRRDSNEATSRSRLAQAGIELGSVLTVSDPRRALAVFDHVLLRLAEVKNNAKARREEVNALARSTYPLRALGRTAEARKRLDAAFARLAELKAWPVENAEPGSEADRARIALADLTRGAGVPRELAPRR